jgi:hypothetical protein
MRERRDWQTSGFDGEPPFDEIVMEWQRHCGCEIVRTTGEREAHTYRNEHEGCTRKWRCARGYAHATREEHEG